GYRQSHGGQDPPPATPLNCKFFERTKHYSCEDYGYLLDHARRLGLPDDPEKVVTQLFGDPISELEDFIIDGKRVGTVQWFEKTRLEYRTGSSSGSGYQLGLLGSEL